MFIRDGIVYAGEPNEPLGVMSAELIIQYYMLVTFNTGEQRVFDATQLLNNPAFNSLNDESVYKIQDCSRSTYLDE